MSVPDAVRSACRYVEAGIRSAPKIGGGSGPLNHFHSIYSLPFTQYVTIALFYLSFEGYLG